GIRKEFESLLSAARFKVDLVSPWISPEIVEDLFKLHLERHLRIRIITRRDPENAAQVRSLEILTQLSKDYSPSFQAKVMDELHAKGMLIDDVMLLYGSFNFTISGLNANVENVVIDFSLQGTKKFNEEFNELWKNAKSLV
ncbi:MAG: phospholipase D family protein, partial [Nitrososphaeria archaeon]